jgi:hypothetical protein
MRSLLVVMSLLLASPLRAGAQVEIRIGLPSLSIGFDQPSYPQLVQVPGYPVYYDPSAPSNYFFYDGLYWVYESDTWYASAWFNGPWDMVEPEEVPYFVLRVPVRYYRQPPGYFRGWRDDEPPRWGEHWGSAWERRRSGWDRWDRREVPAPAPLPTYQRQFAGDRYPRQPQEQQALNVQNYRHQPSDPAVSRVSQARAQHAAQQKPQQVAPAETQRAQPQQNQANPPRQQAAPAAHPAAPAQAARPAQEGRPQQREPQAKPRAPQGAGPARERPSQEQAPKGKPGGPQEPGRHDDEHGRDHG